MNEQTAPQKVTGIGPMLHNLRRKSRLARLFVLCIPPIIQNVCNKLLVAAQQRSLPELPAEFAALPFAQHALLKLTRDYDFERVLDIGAGAGLHSNVLAAHGKKVTALDFGASIYADKLDTVQEGVTRVEANFYEVSFDQPFDCCWASHVLEHQPDPGRFLRRCIELTR